MVAKKKYVSEDNLNIAFYLILPLLLLPPFFRGLFFDYEADIAHIYTAIVLAAYVFIRKDSLRLPKNVMDYAFIGLAAAYVISNFVAFNQRAAVEGALRVFNFYVIYLILAKTVREIKDFRMAFNFLFASGVGVALAGLGTAYGTFSFNGAFDQGMILSTLQYHNAAAIYLVGAGIIGLGLLCLHPNIWVRIAIGGLNYIVFVTAFGAGSRGAMLVAPIGLLLLILGQPKEYRLKVFLNFLVVLVPFALTAKKVLTFGVNSAGYYWGWLLVGTLIGIGCQFLVEKFLSISEQTRKKVVAAVGIGITVIIIGAILYFGSEIMPESIANRIKNINMQDTSVKERFYFYSDSFKLIKDYPVLGTGGGGWNSAYTWYQSYLYFTTEVHSHPMQVWVETGTIGFMFYLLIWIGLIVSIFKIMRKAESPEYRCIAWTAAVNAVAISMHSAIDFSLSLGGVAILMYSSIGIVRAVEAAAFNEDRQSFKIIVGPSLRKIAVLVLAVIFGGISFSFYLAAEKEKEAIALYNSGDVQGAIDKFTEARKFDSVNFNYPMYLSSLYNNLAYQKQDVNMVNEAIKNAEEAEKLNKKSFQPLWTLAETYLYANKPADAVIIAEQAQQAMIWRQEGYENLGKIYMAAAQQYVQIGQKDKAKETLVKVTKIPTLIEERVKNMKPFERKANKGPLLENTANIKQIVDEAGKLLKTL
jgi:tetratricopeptide (TPR) repeat protein